MEFFEDELQQAPPAAEATPAPEEMEFQGAPAPAEVPAATQPIDLAELTGGDGPAPGAPVDAGDAFIDAYIPAAAQETDHTPEITDPRVAWRKKNQEALKAKDAEEAAAKKAFYDKAQEHLKKVKETRTKTLSTRKDTNRAAAKSTSSDMGVPKEGSSWDKVTALVNWQAGAHQKDTSRFKSTLISLKTVKA